MEVGQWPLDSWSMVTIETSPDRYVRIHESFFQFLTLQDAVVLEAVKVKWALPATINNIQFRNLKCRYSPLRTMQQQEADKFIWWENGTGLSGYKFS